MGCLKRPGRRKSGDRQWRHTRIRMRWLTLTPGSIICGRSLLFKPGGFGAVGFCYGGHLAMMLAARSREIDAVVPYHPGPTSAADVARLTAPVQIHQGTADRNIPVQQIKDLEKVLRAQKTPVEVFWYDGADHGFLAYTRPYYRPNYAKDSWDRTILFLDKHLRKTMQ